MYNQLNDKYAMQAGQAASLQSNYITNEPDPEQMPMSAMAQDLVSGLRELNERLRAIRTQIFGSEPEANNAKQGGPTSLGQAICFAGMELREAHSLAERILNRL